MSKHTESHNAARYIPALKIPLWVYLISQSPYTGCPLNGVGVRVRDMEEVKENKKVLYHFAVFAIVNELLIIKKSPYKSGLLANATARRDAAA